MDDNRCSILQQRQRLLHREKEPFHIDVEDRVIERLSDCAERGILKNPGIGEHNVAARQKCTNQERLICCSLVSDGFCRSMRDCLSTDVEMPTLPWDERYAFFPRLEELCASSRIERWHP
jgi:hypothetical protein